MAAINYKVQAEVVNIRTDTPCKDDAFLVDSNVWFWMTYTKASNAGARAYQTSNYPAYVDDALDSNASVYHCGLSLAELAHLIEKTEREAYSSAIRSTILPKEYRHNFPTERAKVVAEVEAAWTQVKGLAEPLGVQIDADVTDAALARFETEAVDGYDLFILEMMNRKGITQVITDDGDFATVPNIQVFTSNRSVIDAARTQGKLTSR